MVAVGSLESTGPQVPGQSIQAAPAPPPETIKRVDPADLAAMPASAPLAITFDAAGIGNQPITPYTDAEVADRNGVNPYSMEQISWWTGGGMPGSEGTTYLYGHTWIEPAAFNGLPSVQLGDQFTIATAEGAVTYEVVDKFSIAKPAFAADARVAADTPGRVVLATCDRNATICPSCRTVDNVVVIGQAI